MGIFNNFPWSNYQQLNLDWIIRTIKNLVYKTEKAVSVEPQNLTDSEKEQARENIDALPANSVDAEIARRAVMYDREQTLTESQKAQARENIGVSQSGEGGAVLYNENQNLSTEEKYRARVNIDAIDQVGVIENIANNAVLYDRAQSISAQQKSNARNNIDVYSKTETNNSISTATKTTVRTTQQTLTKVQKAQVRTNINVYSKEETDNAIENVVRTVPQTFTDEQKEQTRNNIDVYSKEETDNAISTASANGFNPTLVWTNPNVESEFGTADANSSVDIEVNLTNTKFVLIDFRVVGSVYSPWILFDANDNGVKGVCVGMSTEIVCSRRITIKKSENKINFGYGSSSGDTKVYYSNSVGIPYHVYVINE